MRGPDVVTGTLGGVGRSVKPRSRVERTVTPMPRGVRAGTPRPSVARVGALGSSVTRARVPMMRVARAGVSGPCVAWRQSPKYLQQKRGRVEQSCESQDWTRRGNASRREVCRRRQRERMTRRRRCARRPTDGSWFDLDTGTPYAQKSTREKTHQQEWEASLWRAVAEVFG
jgi:hypothetical protein